ncbi:hypothetical protein M758_11G006000 [Ceratodon purpureus]|nr:hypothetical protein M758_11G006000 [Ceratodon purpureus]
MVEVETCSMSSGPEVLISVSPSSPETTVEQLVTGPLHLLVRSIYLSDGTVRELRPNLRMDETKWTQRSRANLVFGGLTYTETVTKLTDRSVRACVPSAIAAFASATLVRSRSVGRRLPVHPRQGQVLRDGGERGPEEAPCR